MIEMIEIGFLYGATANFPEKPWLLFSCIHHGLPNPPEISVQK